MGRFSFLAVGCIALAAFVFLGCGTPLGSQEILKEQRGINLEAEHAILSLKYNEELITRESSNFGGFFFLIAGAARGGSKKVTAEEAFVGFITHLNDGSAVMLKFRSNIFDFVIKPGQETPTVRFVTYNKNMTWVDEGEANEVGEMFSTTEVLEESTTRVIITISPEHFSEDIAVLKYAYGD